MLNPSLKLTISIETNRVDVDDDDDGAVALQRDYVCLHKVSKSTHPGTKLQSIKTQEEAVQLALDEFQIFY